MKYYFFGSTQGKIYTLHGFCCAFGLFHHFLGGFQVFVADFYRWSQGWTELFGKTWTRRWFFSLKFGCTTWFSPATHRRRVQFCPTFSSAGEKFPPFHSNLNDFYSTTTAFNFPQHPVTVPLTLAQLEFSISDCSSMTTATYQTGAQSKLFIKNIIFAPQPLPSWL